MYMILSAVYFTCLIRLIDLYVNTVYLCGFVFCIFLCLQRVFIFVTKHENTIFIEMFIYIVFIKKYAYRPVLTFIYFYTRYKFHY